MEKTYRVTARGGSDFYTVTLGAGGVVAVDGLLPETAENIKAGVARHIERRHISPLNALHMVVGSYSDLVELTDL